MWEAYLFPDRKAVVKVYGQPYNGSDDKGLRAAIERLGYVEYFDALEREHAALWQRPYGPPNKSKETPCEGAEIKWPVEENPPEREKAAWKSDEWIWSDSTTETRVDNARKGLGEGCFSENEVDVEPMTEMNEAENRGPSEPDSMKMNARELEAAGRNFEWVEITSTTTMLLRTVTGGDLLDIRDEPILDATILAHDEHEKGRKTYIYSLKLSRI